MSSVADTGAPGGPEQPPPPASSAFVEARVRGADVQVTVTRAAIQWSGRSARRSGQLPMQDVVGAVAGPGPRDVTVLRLLRRRQGRRGRVMHRTRFTLDDADAVAGFRGQVVACCGPEDTPPAERRLLVVANPHGGARRAERIYDRFVEPVLAASGVDVKLVLTTHAGHAGEIAAELAPGQYEGVLFVSGDGLVNEFVNGLLLAQGDAAAAVLDGLSVGVVPAGTDNGLAKGVGTPDAYTSLYCCLKRVCRLVDLFHVTNAAGDRRYSLCGIGWGIAGDIAASSEGARWLGRQRYNYLKVKFATCGARRHVGTLRYVEYPDVPLTRCGLGCETCSPSCTASLDQAASVSPATLRERLGYPVAEVVAPASGDGGGEEQQEDGRYVTVGALNTVPDGKFVHGSDGAIDLVIARKGGLCRTIALGVRYVFGAELGSALMDYKKVSFAVITPDNDDCNLNVDGEVLEGPGPFVIGSSRGVVAIYGEV